MRNFIVTIDGNQYEVGVEEVGATASTAPVAPVAAAPVAKAPVAAAPKASSAPANGVELKSPMPGMVKKLCVAEGATVKKGDVIIVFEAMKMDNDLNAPCDGKVSFKVATGANVDTGAVIAIVG